MEKNTNIQILDEIHKLNGEAVFAYTDLKNIDSCEKMFQTAVKNFGKLMDL